MSRYYPFDYEAMFLRLPHVLFRGRGDKENGGKRVGDYYTEYWLCILYSARTVRSLLSFRALRFTWGSSKWGKKKKKKKFIRKKIVVINSGHLACQESPSCTRLSCTSFMYNIMAMFRLTNNYQWHPRLSFAYGKGDLVLHIVNMKKHRFKKLVKRPKLQINQISWWCKGLVGKN